MHNTKKTQTSVFCWICKLDSQKRGRGDTKITDMCVRFLETRGTYAVFHIGILVLQPNFNIRSLRGVVSLWPIPYIKSTMCQMSHPAL